jgi:hypothetical protein
VRRSFHSAHAFVNGPLCSSLATYIAGCFSLQSTKTLTENPNHTEFMTKYSLKYSISNKTLHGNIVAYEMNY